MRIVFIGTVDLSERIIKAIIRARADIVGVVTMRSSPFNSDFCDLSSAAKEAGIPYKYISDINSAESVEWIRARKPDIIFCIGFSQILKKQILGIPPKGVIGYHPALLPANRGRHPVVWALALGLKKTGSTFFFMDGGADSGDIVSQKDVRISIKDDAGTLYGKITRIACGQVLELLPMLEGGSYKRRPQMRKMASYWRKRTVKDGEIDFRMSAVSVYDLVRALARPYAGAHVMYGGRPVKIWRTGVVRMGKANDEPGKVVDSRGSSITVKCGIGSIRLLEHEFDTLPKKGEYIQ